MGLYDRDYYQEERESRFVGGDRPVVTTLILINIGVFVIDYFSQGQLTNWLALRSDLLTHPWYAYQLVTAGFLHSTDNIWHIIFNMYSLWLFGREVETLYGRAEFLRVYLVLLVLSSLTWVVCENLINGFAEPPRFMLGASGAVTGIIILFACNFPRRVLLIWGVLPVQAWVLALIFVALDLIGTRQAGTNTAYTAHLGGAAFGFLYFRTRSRFGEIGSAIDFSQWFKRRPKLKLRRAEDDDDLNTRVDKVLEKISREGEESLTRAERKLLENASRRYQQRRR